MSRTPPQPPAEPLVGRHDEQARLDDALDAAQRGEPRVVIVAGNAGIGKSRLVHEVVARRTDDWLVAVGHCVDEGDAGLPYAPLTGILAAIAGSDVGAALLDDIERTAPGLLPLVRGGDSAVDTTSGLSQLRLLDALVRLIHELTQGQATVLVIEDMQWGDPSTRAFVAFLCRHLLPQRLAVVITVRTDDLHRKHPLRPMLAELSRLHEVRRVDLEPLADDELGELLAGVHGTPLPREAVERIARRSGGNPFFAEQLLAVGAERADVRLPDELTDLLLHRVDQLTSDARYVLEVASLAGQRIEHDVLIGICDRKEREVTAALHEAADSRLFEPVPGGTEYSFRHALLAEVVAAGMLPAERRRLHGRYADFMEGRGSAAVVAHHRFGAGELAGAFAASVDAALEATSIAAPSDALQHWERVLELWPHSRGADRRRVGGRSSAAREAAQAAERAGAMTRAVELARLAVDAADTAEERVRARLVLVPLLTPMLTGDPSDYLSQASATLDEADGDPELAVRAKYVVARAHFLAGHFQEAVPLAESAVVGGKRLGLDDLVLGARATGILARQELGDEQPDAESTLVPAALAADDVEIGLWVLTKLADRYWPTEPATGERIAAQAYDHAAAYGARSSLQAIGARVTLALSRWLSGNWDAVEELVQAEPLAINDATAGAVALEAEVDIARGRVELARERLERAMQVVSDPLTYAFVAISMADLYIADGRPAEAVTLCVESLSKVPPPSGFGDAEVGLVHRGLMALGDCHDLGVDVPDGAALLDAADRVDARLRDTSVARISNRPLMLMRAHRSRLSGGDVALWRTGLEHCRAVPYEAATCRLHLAEALLSNGDASSAATELHTAADEGLQLGAVTLLGRIEALAARARIPLTPSEAERPQHARWNLTAREHQVLQLVAEGRTNRQIGEELYISEKTASVHVSNILGKLGAANRGEATAIARRSGLLPGARP